MWKNSQNRNNINISTLYIASLWSLNSRKAGRTFWQWALDREKTAWTEECWAFLFFFVMSINQPYPTNHNVTLLSLARSFYTTTVYRLSNQPTGYLVARADFLICVFQWDGAVALCNCLKDTKTCGFVFTKDHVWSHVIKAPAGTQRWRRSGQA